MNRLKEHATRNLSALVITVEFILISVMIGVVLFPLMDNAKNLLRDLRVEYWLYIVSGLLFILYIWTEVVTHTLSFIGWPIEFGHNLLYIVFALFLAVQMNFLADPRGWFALTLANTLIAIVLVLYDRRVILRRGAGAQGSELAVFQLALERQNGLVRMVPLTLLSSVATLALIILFPGFFLEQAGHLILVVVQIFSIVFLLTRTIRTFNSWAEPILQKAMDELRMEDPQP